MKPEMIKSIPCGATIIHLNTGGRYRFLRVVRVKIRGNWVNGATYCDPCGNEYCRTLDDFYGFKLA